MILVYASEKLEKPEETRRGIEDFDKNIRLVYILTLSLSGLAAFVSLLGSPINQI
jgi:hypothetical protein